MKKKLAILIAAACTVIAAPAQIQFKTLFNFNGTDGIASTSLSLIQGTDGNFYGTTQSGGALLQAPSSKSRRMGPRR